MDNNDLNQMSNIKYDSNICKGMTIEIEFEGNVEDKDYIISITHYIIDLIDKQMESKLIHGVLGYDKNMILTLDFNKVEQQTYALGIIRKKTICDGGIGSQDENR